MLVHRGEFSYLHERINLSWPRLKTSRNMDKRLLKAKHWQIFLLTFGLPIIVPVAVLMLLLFLSPESDDLTSILLTSGIFIYLLSVIVFAISILAWLWAVGTGLQSKIGDELSMRSSVFKTVLLLFVVYIISPLALLSAFQGNTQLGDFLVTWGFFFIPLHFLMMLCILFCLFFVAKTYKTAILQRKVTFSDFAGDFFLIWFFPIGIWIVQPKINELVSE